MPSLKNRTFRRGGFTKNQYRGRGLPKKGGLGQFADLRGGAWQERGDVAFERGEMVDTPMHTMGDEGVRVFDFLCGCHK